MDQQDRLQIGFLRAFVQVKNELKIKVQQLWNYSTIPAHLHSTGRSLKSISGCLWLADEQFTIISIIQVRNRVKVWLMDQPEPEEKEYFVEEIVYRHNQSWKTRPIRYRHRHPSENIHLVPIPSGLRCLRIFIDLYYDDFGTFRNVYHSLGGVYIQFGNMPFYLRKLLKNHFPLGFVPFGAKFADFIQPFIEDMQRLQDGIRMTLYNGEDVYIRAGLGVITADLPQGNDLCGVKRHGANHGCRSCEAGIQELTDHNYDIIRHSRYQHISDMQFFEIESQRNPTTKKRIATKYGISLEKSILHHLYHDRHQQCPQDLYHAMAGKAKKLMECTLALFTDKGNDTFLKIWKSLELPKSWSKLPNPITHQKSFMMSDMFHLAMLMPHVLNRCLISQHIKERTLNNLWNTIGCQRRDQVVGIIIKCWVSLSLSIKQSFAITFSINDNFETLTKVLQRERENLIKVLICLLLSLHIIILITLSRYFRNPLAIFQIFISTYILLRMPRIMALWLIQLVVLKRLCTVYLKLLFHIQTKRILTLIF
jgi:hypothetical protein